MSESKEKVFVLRESRLTELFHSNKDMRSAFNLCFAIFILLFATTISYYLIDKNEFYSDIIWLKWCFGAQQFHLLAFSWLKMQFSAITILYPIIRIWLWSKTKYQSIIDSKSHDSILISIGICYQSFLFVYALNYILNHDMSPVCAFALIMEQIRLSMKSHSFIEENRFRQITTSKDESSCQVPTLSQFLYFLVAPTLLYRDKYIRTERIRWRIAFWYFIQFFAIIFSLFAINWRFIEHNFKLTGIKAFEIKQLIHLLLYGSLIGMQLCLAGFYGLLHCWLNGFAEILRFGDRQFYTDWWNCSDFTTFYRKWNIVVHEWLKAYVYNPSLKLTNGNRVISGLSVFILSAIIHEYILAVSFRFFLPVLFSFFCANAIIIVFFVGKSKSKDWSNETISNNCQESDVFDSNSQNTSLRLGSLSMFIGLCIGWGLLIIFYSMEMYSRINCPSNDKSFQSYFLPRFLSCVTIE